MSKLKLSEKLKCGVTLETIESQLGTEVLSETLILRSDGIFEHWQINCFSSGLHDLGTCRCQSHPADIKEELTLKESLPLIKKFMEGWVDMKTDDAKNAANMELFHLLEESVL